MRCIANDYKIWRGESIKNNQRLCRIHMHQYYKLFPSSFPWVPKSYGKGSFIIMCPADIYYRLFLCLKVIANLFCMCVCVCTSTHMHVVPAVSYWVAGIALLKLLPVRNHIILCSCYKAITLQHKQIISKDYWLKLVWIVPHTDVALIFFLLLIYSCMQLLKYYLLQLLTLMPACRVCFDSHIAQCTSVCACNWAFGINIMINESLHRSTCISFLISMQ